MKASVTPCFYCGVPANSVDHVIPRVLIGQLKMLDDPEVMAKLYSEGRIRIVPACRECNSLLSDLYFDSLEQRRAYLKERLRKRYRKILAMPDYSAAELAQDYELSDRLRGYILNSLAERDFIRERLAWRAPMRVIREVLRAQHGARRRMAAFDHALEKLASDAS